MSKFFVVLIISGVIFGALGVTGYRFYNNFYGVPKEAPTGEYSFEVKTGQTLSEVAEKLEDDKVIVSKSAFLLQSKIYSTKPLQSGIYRLNLNRTNQIEVLKLINENTDRILKELESNKKPTKTVTIREGLQLDQVFQILEENGIASKSELAEFATNPLNFDRAKYEFLPQPLNCNYADLTNCAKYYIEGYAYPNTYNFFIPSTPAEVFAKFLDTFNTEVWVKIKPDLGDRDFEKAVILASVLEKETGRPKTGITESNRDEVNYERRLMSQVFLNRNKLGMNWGSDVTVEYGHGRRLCQQTFTVDNCIFLDSPEANTKYNTYQNKGYPIAPITSPVYDNIFASLNPIENDYLYFVSDVTGKKYFTKNEPEFLKSIEDIKIINRELGVN